MREPDWSSLGARAEASFARLCTQLGDLPPGITIDGFIDAAIAVGDLDNYKCFHDVARCMVGRITALRGRATTQMFLRAALNRTICANVARRTYQQLPPLCARYHAAQLERIASDGDVSANWLDLTDDLFQKEFGIVSLRLYVAGSNLVDYRCGISRSIILRGGVRKIATNLRVISRLGGFKPYFQGHIHNFNLAALNERAREDFYRCCVELFALHPDILGMFCSSWYYDPVLDVISPRLTYLRSTPVAGGAHLMQAGAGGDAIANATARSQTRRRLYDSGNYLPKTYMFVWGRDDMEAWVREHPRTEA